MKSSSEFTESPKIDLLYSEFNKHIDLGQKAQTLGQTLHLNLTYYNKSFRE